MDKEMGERQEESKTLFAIFIEQFSAHKVALASLYFLVTLGLVAICAPFVVNLLGVNPTDQNIVHRFAGVGSRLALPSATQEERIQRWLDDNHIPLGERFVLHIAEALRVPRRSSY